ncbi:oocyte zinc finger protein XlCOF8.4-like [Rana temporaria]|uniref:oocyte zinc finger protein XlCOF8.4-like n=1 Tax=Rana temporaria TaxID=8407 RepID=UPI001AACFEE5|nr:oocyte zinc finger protein XlCOF8.4-like [Rana temporaria]
MVSPFPVSTLRMEKERGHMTERMLNLTLEIIYLLTGENYIAFKLCDGLVAPNLKKTQNPFTVQPPPLSPERNNDKKIEEVTQKMIDLLSGEVPTTHQDASEEHKDLYKDVMMENRPPLTSPDGSSTRNPPERCPRPLYSRDSTQKDQDCQANSVVVIKVEKEEDPYGRNDEPHKEEEDPPEISTDGMYRQYSMEKCSESSPDNEEVDDFPADSPEDSITNDLHPSSHSADLLDPSTHERSPSDPSPPVTFHAIHGTSEKFPCSNCGMFFTQITALLAHKQTHAAEMPYSCPDCGKLFALQNDLLNHIANHAIDQPYSCSYCRKHFLSKSRLDRHEIIHTGHKPYSCSMCGKRFTQKANLARHEKTHTGEKPFACLECGKCFTRKATLIEHQYLHR